MRPPKVNVVVRVFQRLHNGKDLTSCNGILESVGVCADRNVIDWPRFGARRRRQDNIRGHQRSCTEGKESSDSLHRNNVWVATFDAISAIVDASLQLSILELSTTRGESFIFQMTPNQHSQHVPDTFREATTFAALDEASAPSSSNRKVLWMGMLIMLRKVIQAKM